MMILRPSLFLIPLCGLISCETTEPAVKRNYISSYRGMAEEPSAAMNKALVRKSEPATMNKYTKVMIEDVKVIPAKNVPASQKRATKEEGERLAEHFEITLAKELSPHYEITNRRGRNTLLVRAALTDLQPSSPGLFVFNYLPYAAAVSTGLQIATGKTLGAGSTSMEAEVVDSMTRRQLYSIIDQYKGSKFQPAGLERWGQSEGAMRTWSRKIRTGIQGPEATDNSRTSPAAKLYFKNQGEKEKPEVTKSSRVVKAGSSKPETKVGNNGARKIVKSDSSAGVQRVTRHSSTR